MAPPAADTASYAGGYSTNLRDITIAGLLPFTTVIWILALAATLPRSRRTAATAAFETGG